MKNELSNEEKKRLSYERQNAVRKAWKEEQARVTDGHGTRKWTPEEQEEILSRGSVRGYEGHHMKSVSLYPEYAGDPKNIQFLNEDEHLLGAHNGDYHNLTNGYYDPETGIMNEFGEGLGERPVYDLETSEKVDTMESIKEEYAKDADTQLTSASENDIQKAKESVSDSDDDNNHTTTSKDEGQGFSGGRR